MEAAHQAYAVRPTGVCMKYAIAQPKARPRQLRVNSETQPKGESGAGIPCAVARRGGPGDVAMAAELRRGAKGTDKLPEPKTGATSCLPYASNALLED